MLRYLYSLSKLCMCTEVHARKGIRFAQSFLESICRGFIVYIKPPAVCGVFQPWESVFALWVGIRNERGSEKRDVLSEEQWDMFFDYYDNQLKKWIVGH